MLLLAAAFTACDENFEDWAKPISNPEPQAITIAGVSATAAATNVDLAKVDEAVKLVTVSTASAPEGTTFDKMRMVLTPQNIADAEPVTLQAISTSEGTFSKESLQELIVNIYGRRPDVRTFDARVYLDGIYNGQAAYIDAGSVQLTLIPEAPVIAQNYYIVGGPNDWAGSAASKELKFQHSDLDVYEDPIFTIIFDAAPSGDTWFAIGDDEGCDAIAGGDWSKLFGIVGGQNDAASGSLDYRYNLGGDNSFKMPAGPKRIKVVIDMMERTFTVTPVNIAENYYLVGGRLDWAGSAASKEQKFSHSDKDVSEDPVFTIVIDGAEGDTWFAIGDDEACDAITNNGDWSKLYGTTAGNGQNGTSGTLARRTSLSDDGSFCVPGGSKYIKVVINMAELTYEIQSLNFSQFIYFIGATDGWNNDETQRQRLESPACDGVYTGYIYMADPNGWGNEFKFQQVKGDWGSEVNSGHMTGGITGDLADGGGNFKATGGEGVYYVVLNLGNNTLSGTRIQNMNLVGDFNGWNAADNAQQMTWNATDYCFEITGAGVTAAGWKFTANNGWGINLGGNTTDVLTQDGPNISAVGSTIKLYPTRRTSDNIFCTVQ